MIIVKRIFPVVLITFVLFSGCATEKTQTPDASISGEPTEQDIIREDIQKLVEGNFGHADAAVFVKDESVEVRISYIDSTTETPDGWDEARNNAVSTSESIMSSVQEHGIGNVILCLMDDNDTYLLNVSNGTIAYDAFDVESHVAYNADTITMEEFNQITTGMTYDEVVSIIGGEGEILSQTDLGLGSEYNSVMYEWQGEGGIGANANVMFQGGVVVSKAQFGLE